MRFATGRQLHFCLAALAAVLMVGIAATARAELVTFAFTGTIDFSDMPPAANISVGDTLSGSYTFESTTPPRAGGTSASAVYDALTHFEFALSEGYAASSSGAPEIQIDNDPVLPDVDRYAVVSRAADGLVGPDAAGLPLIFFGLRLDDSTNSAISDALILPTSLNLADFDNRQFFIFFGSINDLSSASGTITSLTVVPEPSSIALAAFSGLAGLVLYWRRRSVRAV